MKQKWGKVLDHKLQELKDLEPTDPAYKNISETILEATMRYTANLAQSGYLDLINAQRLAAIAEADKEYRTHNLLKFCSEYIPGPNKNPRYKIEPKNLPWIYYAVGICLLDSRKPADKERAQGYLDIACKSESIAARYKIFQLNNPAPQAKTNGPMRPSSSYDVVGLEELDTTLRAVRENPEEGSAAAYLGMLTDQYATFLDVTPGAVSAPDALAPLMDALEINERSRSIKVVTLCTHQLENPNQPDNYGAVSYLSETEAAVHYLRWLTAQNRAIVTSSTQRAMDKKICSNDPEIRERMHAYLGRKRAAKKQKKLPTASAAKDSSSCLFGMGLDVPELPHPTLEDPDVIS